MDREKFERKYFNAQGHEVTFGQYVLTPVLQEDGSYSFWLAKKGYIVAMYCFTIGHGGFSYNQQLKEMQQYIKMYNNVYVKKK